MENDMICSIGRKKTKKKIYITFKYLIFFKQKNI